MGWNGIIWTVIVGIGLPSLAAVIAGRGRRETTSPEDRRAELAGEAAVRESTASEPAEDPTVQEERLRLLEAKASAEKTYSQRIGIAEHEFCARKNRADVHLRAAELFLERAQEGGRVGEHESEADGQAFGVDLVADDFVVPSRPTPNTPAVNLTTRLTESPERRRTRRIRDARERLADAMLEHRFVVAAAEKLLADAKAEDGDVLSATDALEAFKCVQQEAVQLPPRAEATFPAARLMPGVKTP